MGSVIRQFLGFRHRAAEARDEGGAAQDLVDPPTPVSELHPWERPFPEAATLDDIIYCFRLLLGRNTSSEEWPGHSSRAGEPLSDVVATYLNSREFHNRGLQIPEMPEGIVHKNNGRFEIFANLNDPIIGSPALAGSYEPEVTSVIENLLKPGDIFVDVGANIGYFSLLGALLVGREGHVYAVEPNDLNVKLLESSRKANSFENISVMQVGASTNIETLFLNSLAGNGETARLGEFDIFATRTVAGLPLDVLLSSRRKAVSLIKIDVEGFEYRALQGAEKILSTDRPHIIFEFAAAGIDGISGEGFLSWLTNKGYEFVPVSDNVDLSTAQSVDAVMGAFRRGGKDHIDILAKPIT
ncbi:FkbM family methyltransferase [Rhizobium miluonense]|uniref:FkbM family methyltransferase n=1 Tax=Rhizobium miluonense TaxID=411945 RepID=A0ABU1SRA5_9HYPH|nr:FkbM family methyltransferase [Rhizobium miluonense]MDR6901454.1 FkbM family methyltransferase [Rhizobium miluonense]